MVSDDTILRQLLRAAQVSPPHARVIRIDDWSWRKSQTYGTTIIDLKRRAVIDVLEDRDVVTCIDWLRRHPEVEVINGIAAVSTPKPPDKERRRPNRSPTGFISCRTFAWQSRSK